MVNKEEKKRALVSTPKKTFDPLVDCNTKLLQLTDIANAVQEIAPESILFTAVPKPEVDFCCETSGKPAEELS